MLFNDPKVIFIHIPKAGGSSIESVFTKSHWLLERNGKMGQHERLQLAANIYGDLSEYKMFTVVRNTYERLVSLYCMFYSRGGVGFRRLGLRKVRPRQNRYVAFSEYYNKIHELWSAGEHDQMQFAQDFWWYCGIDGEIPDNLEILRFENLEEDFKKLWCDEWGLELNIEFPHINENKKVGVDSSLREYLLKDPEFIKVINEIYEKEIQHFNFKPPFNTGDQIPR